MSSSGIPASTTLPRAICSAAPTMVQRQEPRRRLSARPVDRHRRRDRRSARLGGHAARQRRRQAAGADAQMIFDVATILASLSRGMTLEPGDIIASGTPDGVGFARTPPEFLVDGDTMEVEISRNRRAAQSRRRQRRGGGRAVIHNGSLRGEARVELRGLRKRFANGTQALDGIDLDVADGEFAAIVGPSGCGKTTLLRIVAGLEAAGEGSVRVRAAQRPGGLASAVVFQGASLFPWLRVGENVALGLDRLELSRDEIARRVEEQLARVGLRRFRQRVSRPTLGRHAPARGGGARVRGRSRDLVPGRAFRRARRTDAGRAGGSNWRVSGKRRARRSCSSRTASKKRWRWPTGSIVMSGSPRTHRADDRGALPAPARRHRASRNPGVCGACRPNLGGAAPGMNLERIMRVLSPLALIAMWEICVRAHLLDARFFPAPTPSRAVSSSSRKAARSRAIWASRWSVSRRGSRSAAIPGVAIGLLIGINRWARAVIEPDRVALSDPEDRAHSARALDLRLGRGRGSTR